ncbi:hypothetical protein [Clostridium tyrobutyricum]|uniref:hypothetical protein n=1 Tax=Clostridium tyrobutyricum TaxID=1519 RepID=UPI001C38455D|nr:hypothetical protein [Clostridium tyrobutyricum]MBV4422914.1 hypothetical protein [Clostridium tyrobutyricum]
MALQQNININIEYNNSSNLIQKLNDAGVNAERLVTKTIVFNNAYLKVTDIFGTKEQIDFNLGVFKDNTKSTLLDSYHYSFKPDSSDNGKNIIKQCYEYVKKLPQYLDSVDILESGQTV